MRGRFPGPLGVSNLSPPPTDRGGLIGFGGINGFPGGVSSFPFGFGLTGFGGMFGRPGGKIGPPIGFGGMSGFPGGVRNPVGGGRFGGPGGVINPGGSWPMSGGNLCPAVIDGPKPPALCGDPIPASAMNNRCSVIALFMSGDPP